MDVKRERYVKVKDSNKMSASQEAYVLFLASPLPNCDVGYDATGS